MEKTKSINTKAARDYLAQIGKAERLIDRLMQTAEGLRHSMTGRNYTLNPDKVQTSQGNRTEETMVKLIDLERQIDSYIDELVERKRDALERIRRVPDIAQQEILVARYVQLENIEDIAKKLDRSDKWIFKLHRQALVMFVECNTDLA